MAACSSSTTFGMSILFFLTVSGAAQVQRTCQTLPGFDVANLTMPDYWVLKIDECTFGSRKQSCNLTMAFCKPLTSPAACVGSGACLTYHNGTEWMSSSFGVFKQHPFLGSEGSTMVAYYYNGVPYQQPHGKSCNISSQLIFSCNESVLWIPSGSVAVPPEPIYTDFQPMDCQFAVQFVYAGGCYRSTGTTGRTGHTESSSAPVTSPANTTHTTPPFERTCQTLPGFDVANLTLPDYWVLKIDECTFGSRKQSCNLTMAFCKPLTSPAACVGSGACLTYHNGTEWMSSSFGVFKQHPFLGSEGSTMVAYYYNGVPYQQPHGKSCNISSQLIFSCNESVLWIPSGSVAVPPEPIYTDFQPMDCQFAVQFVYAGGCYRSAIPLTPSSGTRTHSLSAMSFLLIPLLAAIKFPIDYM